MVPVINIVIVTYNAAATLQQCLNSIYAQEYPAIDIIIIDGKSTDGTVQVIESNASKIKFWLSEKDNGIYDAMNKATGHLNGNWVYFLGADDELFPEFSAMADELKDDSHIYYGSVLSNGKKQSGELSAYYMAKGGIYHQAVIYPREVFNRYKFELKYRIVADNVLNMTCYKDKDFEFEYKDHIIAKFNHLGTSGISVDTLFERDKTRLIFKNFGYKIGFRYLFRLLKARLKG